ncbi:DUF1264-domain-containing protein [Lophium mytilinum]|uniref:DUF1264-domain-containing protein n=1 Tax=Lophium mytilinum TaxID=390894 RepID=A0A6A6QCL5_9PEZI|nr:DUF1264-domain-containing protein [Lophium mytilinum]
MSNESLPTTNAAAGTPLTAKSHILETGAAATQNFAPVSSICAHLNAFHAYVEDPTRCVETNHYCAHLNEDVRQCILYDSPDKNARLIGIEYMISPRLFEGLEAEEKKLWHSHVFEVKSGMLIMPKPQLVPRVAWEAAETAEMEEVVHLYGKVYHLWQTDRGDKVPLGPPQLMGSYTAEGQMEGVKEGGFEKLVGGRDERFGEDWRRKREIREGIEVPEISGEADVMWKK